MEAKERVLRLKDVLEIVPIGRSTLWNLVSKGKFPKPFYPSPRLPLWRETEIQQWIKNPQDVFSETKNDSPGSVYLFRFTDSDAGYMGIAIAKEKDQLFNEIDMYGDPYSCQVKKIDPQISFCFRRNKDTDSCEELELSETILEKMFLEKTRWVNPRFKKQPAAKEGQ